MPWLKLQLEADRDCVGCVAQALEDRGALAVTLEAAGGQTEFEVEHNSARPWPRSRVSGLFPQTADIRTIVQQIEAHAGRTLAYSVEPLPDRDWQTVWSEHVQPMCFGKDLWVCPTCCVPPQPDSVNVFIDPGLAFGSGTHPSTQLCLEWLASHEFKGEDVIDYGCGSGILAIVALKLGAQRAWGVDNDARALEVSHSNAVQNYVAARYQALAPDSLPMSLAADIVLANILARPLIELATRLMRLLRPGGTLLLAGLLAEQVDMVRSRYARELALETRFRKDDTQRDRWAMLIGTRKRHSR